MRRSSGFAAFKFPDFRIFWVGLCLSRIGSEMQIVAVSWHLYELTRSPISLGIIGLTRIIGLVTISPIAGHMADMYSRKKIILVAQTIMMLSSFLLALLTLFRLETPVFIYIILVVHSAAATLDTPARQSLLPSLIPKKYFLNAVTLMNILWQSSVVIGPALGGFIIALSGITAVYFLNTASFLAVIAAVFAIKAPSLTTQKLSSYGKSLREGLEFIKKMPIIWSTMLLDFIATFFGSAMVLMPVFAKDIFHGGPQLLGILYSAPSVGGIVTGLIISHLGHIRHQGKVLIAGVLLYGLSTALFGLSRNLYLSLFFLMLAGAGDTISTILRNTIRQMRTPDYLRGRMVAINMIFFMGGPQLGEIEAGFLAGFVGTPLSVFIGGIGTIVSTMVITAIVPKLKRYHGNEIIA